MSPIEKRVKLIIAESLELPVEKIENRHGFAEHLGAGSLDVVELMMIFEDAFGIEITEEAAARLSTVQAVVDFITKALAEQDSLMGVARVA